MATEAAFSRAVREFIARPSKKKKASFIDDVLRNRSAVQAQDVQEMMQQMEKDSLQSNVSRKVVRPVFDAILDYASVIECLSQADPMPTALIWGGFKVVLECFRRYTTLINKIEEQMKRLGRELRRMKEYEKLFESSEDMQQLLTEAYLTVIQFWVRVEMQCKTSGFVLAATSITSFSTSKLDEILSEISENSDNMAKLVPIVQEQVRRAEHKDVVEEHHKVSLVLGQMHLVQKEEREARRKKEVCQWITGGVVLNESNIRHQYQHERALLAGTGAWLLEDPHFRHWRDPDSGSNVLWLHGGMGVGKSVTCANVARVLREQQAVVAVQYFSFDENERLLLLYRQLADQFFHELYYKTQDEMSDEIYLLTQRPATIQSLQTFIKVLVAESQTAYLLVDGLDEEHTSNERWQAANDVMAFFLSVARQSGSSLKLWCSSQDRRKVRDLLSDAEQIHLTAATNNEDIARLFDDTLRSPDFEERDTEAKAAVLQSLKRHVDGNFLWARMMLDATSAAVSMRELQAMLDTGLPGGFEEYLGRKIRSLKPSQHCFLAKVFSCLVYAKRPLLLEELWEALDMADLPTGHNLEPVAFSRRNFLDSCAPLVRVEDIDTGPVHKNLCTLSHGSIRNFLVKNPCIFSFEENCRVTPTFLAYACKKYLQQPRYEKLLIKGSGTFLTACGRDILNQPLLGYCAKYWYRHMDDLSYSPELCREVEKFVRSPHYFTCMQIQSILVGGQFAVWGYTKDKVFSPHLVRVFPRWFKENKERVDCQSDSLLAQYHVAIGEWGYYLNKVSSIRGLYPGQMQRCWWRSLGKANFLHKIPSSIKSFVFEKSDTQQSGETLYLAEGLNADRTDLQLFRLLSAGPKSDENQLRLLCERWSVRPGSRPKLSATSELTVPSDSLRRYWTAEHQPITTVAPIAVSECGAAVRVGSYAYYAAEGFQFKAVELQGFNMDFGEDIAQKGNFIAIASRGRISVEEMPETSTTAANPPSSNSTGIQTDSMCDSESDSESSDSSSDSDSDSGSESDGGIETQETSKDEKDETEVVYSANELDSDLDEEENTSDDDLHDFDSDIDLAPSEENSAHESWSEGSTAALSDEIEDDFVWNEFDKDVSDDEDLDALDEEEDPLEESDDDFENQVKDKVPEETDKASVQSDNSIHFSRSEPDSSNEDAPSTSNSNESSDMDSEPPDPDDSESGSEDSYEGAGGINLDDLLAAGIKTKAPPQARPCRLCVVQTHEEDGRSAEQVFHFFRRAAWPLYASPPVFHPTRPLLVWPLGGNEILFVHYTRKTYFTRVVSSNYPASCEISVQAAFSPCGQYLHLAALHGYTACHPRAGSDLWSDIWREIGAVMGLRMQLSTYRLSHAKLERSPPRLVHRRAVDLDMFFSPENRLSLSQLPITLSWTPRHLYVTQNVHTLRVMRVPLYTGTSSEFPSTDLPTIAVNTDGDVYLPNSVVQRKVYFMPQDDVLTKPKKKAKAKAKAKDKDKDQDQAKDKDKDSDEGFVATILLGSQNTVAHAANEANNRVPPQGAHLTAAQLGHWAGTLPELGNSREAVSGVLRRTETWRGGQLLARVEKFDTSEDCDIVPYLGT